MVVCGFVMDYAWLCVDLYGICMELLWVLCGLCMDFVWHLCDCYRFVMDLSNVIAEALDDVKGVRALDVRCVSIWKSFVCIYNAIV